MEMNDTGREFLRHTLATLAYRGGKALRGVPPGFGAFSAGPTSRRASEILGHIGDLLDWALVYAKEGRHQWRDAPAASWDNDTARFFSGVAALDAFLESGEPLRLPAEQLFQGPIADALTHVGQIALLRRLAGVPVRGENYLRADIVRGRVGAEQTAPRREFD
jgi:hypothetical protein